VNIKYVCSKCGGPKPPKTKCRPCTNARIRARYQPKPRPKVHKKCGRERTGPRCEPCERERLKASGVKHRERRNAARRQRYSENRDAENARKRAYRERNPEVGKAQYRRWSKANPDRIAAILNRRRTRKLGAAGSHTNAEWLAIVKKHGDRCADCGEKKRLQRDHVVPLSRGGSDFAFNIQPLCRSCNSRKRASIAAGTQHSLFDALTA
jgi:5-methylcytosine-specific restriction endonuclease McrA